MNQQTQALKRLVRAAKLFYRRNRFEHQLERESRTALFQLRWSDLSRLADLLEGPDFDELLNQLEALAEQNDRASAETFQRLVVFRLRPSGST